MDLKCHQFSALSPLFLQLSEGHSGYWCYAPPWGQFPGFLIRWAFVGGVFHYLRSPPLLDNFKNTKHFILRVEKKQTAQTKNP